MTLSYLAILLVPFLFMCSNMLDKFQLHGDEEDSGVGALMALGGFFSLVVAVPLGVWVWFADMPLGGWRVITALTFNELLYLGSMWIYMEVLKREETSRVIAYFQAMPIFGVVGAALLLAEIPSRMELVGIGTLVAGGFVLSFQRGKIKWKMAALMVLAAALMAVYDVIFAHYGRELKVVSALFINQAAKFVWTPLLLISPKVRRGFTMAIRTRLKFQSASEMACILADLGFCYFLLYFPVATVQAVCCFQPLFVLVAAVVLSRFYPQVIREEIQRLTLAQKAVGVGLMVAGGVVLAA